MTIRPLALALTSLTVFSFICIPGLIQPADAADTLLVGGVRETVTQEPGIVGIDMRISKRRYPIIKSVFRGSPAHMNGLLPGDVIVEIDRVDTLRKSPEQIDKMISDQPGTLVVFTIRRNNRNQRIPLKVQSLSHVSNNLRNMFSTMVMHDSLTGDI